MKISGKLIMLAVQLSLKLLKPMSMGLFINEKKIHGNFMEPTKSDLTN